MEKTTVVLTLEELKRIATDAKLHYDNAYSSRSLLTFDIDNNKRVYFLNDETIHIDIHEEEK